MGTIFAPSGAQRMAEQAAKQEQSGDYKAELGQYLAELFGLQQQSKEADRQVEALIEEIAKRMGIEIPGQEPQQPQPPASEQPPPQQ